jgi:hypothetical protein
MHTEFDIYVLMVKVRQKKYTNINQSNKTLFLFFFPMCKEGYHISLIERLIYISVKGSKGNVSMNKKINGLL